MVTVLSATEDGKAVGTLPMPDVLLTPIRQDIVHRVHTNMSKNKRQPYAVNAKAGMQQSAISWGYRPRRVAYPPYLRWWYPPLGPGCLRQHVPWWSHVQPDQDLA